MKVHVMLENLILLVIYGIEVVKFIIGTKLVLKESDQKKWMYWIGAGIVIVYLWMVGGNANSLLIYLIIICTTYFSINGKRFDKLIRILLLTFLILSIDETSAGVTRTLVENNKNLSNIRYISIFLDSLWGLIVISTVYLLNRGQRQSGNTDISQNKFSIIILLNGILLILAIGVLNYLKVFVEDPKFQFFTMILVSVAYLCMSLLCWLLVYLRRLNEKTVRELSAEKKLSIYRTNYYKKLIEKEEETRRFRHDINNHLMYLTSLVYEEDIQGVSKYLKSLNHQLQKIDKSVFITGNDLFDVILNEKLQSIHENIKVLVMGKAVCKLQVDDVDLCTIFANLIDNAAEAVEKINQDQAYIIINFKAGHSFLKISIKNSVSTEVVCQKDGLPKTTKNDQKDHGVGLWNVKKTVEKYEGEFKIIAESNEFQVEIVLPLMQNHTDKGVK